MKTKLIFSSIFLCGIINGQGTWLQKTNFGGPTRVWAAGFSIGNKGYIGTGYAGSNAGSTDFWEWDQATNVWTQKADFGGISRMQAVSFSVGTKGYLGLGLQNSFYPTDFWEYNPAANTWTKKADLIAGNGRILSVGFSIGNKGYLGTGYTFSSSSSNDFWEYDPIGDSWTQKANFGGSVRCGAVAFSIGTKGYIGTGRNDAQIKFKDFWEWDQASNTWTQKADFGGAPRKEAVGFSIGNKGYIGTGHDANSYTSDFWEWDQVSNSWSQQTSVSAVTREGAVGFSIGNLGYIGTGGWLYDDFWEWYSLTLSVASTNINCNGAGSGTASVTVTGGAGPFTYSWSNGGSTNYITGVAAGTYTITVTDATGYAASATVSITQPQALSINHTSTNSSCYNNSGSAAVSVGGGTAPYSYLWSTGSSTQSISGIGAGTYSITVLDSNGCTISDTVSIQNSILMNSIPICLVSVDSTSTKNVVIWEKPSSPEPIDSFRIYREVASVFKRIASVPYSSLSIFKDATVGVNPNIAAYKYAISLVDSCGNESAMSSFHKTIHLAISPATPCGYNLAWNDYMGIPVTQYLIYRDSSHTGWKLVDSMSFGNTAWTDITCYPANDTVAYLISVVNLPGCSPSIKNPSATTASYFSSISNSQGNFGNNAVSEFYDELDFQISPNPSNGIFVFDLRRSYLLKGNLDIYNLFGEKIYSSQINSSKTQIDLTAQPNGIYFLQLKTAEGVANKKIIIQR